MAIWAFMTRYISPLKSVNQAFASQYLMENPGHQNMPQSLRSLTITGYWKYYDRGGGDPVAAKRFLVGLYTAAFPEQRLAWDYTDSYGYFELGPIANPGTKLKVREGN